MFGIITPGWKPLRDGRRRVRCASADAGTPPLWMESVAVQYSVNPVAEFIVGAAVREGYVSPRGRSTYEVGPGCGPARPAHDGSGEGGAQRASAPVRRRAARRCSGRIAGPSGHRAEARSVERHHATAPESLEGVVLCGSTSSTSGPERAIFATLAHSRIDRSVYAPCRCSRLEFHPPRNAAARSTASRTSCSAVSSGVSADVSNHHATSPPRSRFMSASS